MRVAQQVEEGLLELRGGEASGGLGQATVEPEA